MQNNSSLAKELAKTVVIWMTSMKTKRPFQRNPATNF